MATKKPATVEPKGLGDSLLDPILIFHTPTNGEKIMTADERPETPELGEALKLAYAGTLKHGAQLLAVWRSNLTNERAKQLADFEAKGLMLGLMIRAPKNRLIVEAILIDAAGGITPLGEISLAGT